MSSTADEELATWLADTRRQLADLHKLDLLLEDAASALGAQADQLFGQLESAGHDRATVQRALAAKAAEQPTPATNPSHLATVRMHRSGRMV